MRSIYGVFQNETVDRRLFVSLTPGFSRVWQTNSTVKTVSTVFLAGLETVKTVFDALARICTLLKQGVNEMQLAEPNSSCRKERINV